MCWPMIATESSPRNGARPQTISYNIARQALPAFENLIEQLDARWALISYSTDGNMSPECVLRVLGERGDLQVFTRKYKRYRVSTPRMSPRPQNVEFLAVVNLNGRPSPTKAPELAERIARQECEASQ